MIVSRLSYAALSKKLSADNYMRYANLITVALLTVALLSNSVPVWFVIIFLSGLVGGTAYTAKFILACTEFPEFSATATAMTGVLAALGSMSFSAIGGAVADAGNFTAAMFIPLGSFVLVSMIFFFGYKGKKLEKTA